MWYPIHYSSFFFLFCSARSDCILPPWEKFVNVSMHSDIWSLNGKITEQTLREFSLSPFAREKALKLSIFNTQDNVRLLTISAGCWLCVNFVWFTLSLSLLHKAAIVDDWRVMNCTTGKWECIYVLSYIFSNPRIKQQKEKKTRHTISLSAVLSSAISNWPLNCFDSLCGDLSRMNVAVWTCCCAQPPTVDI